MTYPKVAIIANPVSGSTSARKVTLARDLIAQSGREVEVLHTRERGDGERLAREAGREGFGLVVAAGGDGTFNEVANALCNSSVPMAILPLGTTNVLAKELGIPGSVEGAVKRALGAEPKTVRLGRLDFASGTTRYFMLMAGIGFDAEAVRGLRRDGLLMKLSGKAAHVASGLRVLRKWKPPALKINIDGREHLAYSLIVCNGAKYAGHIKVAPDADISAPGLYAFIMGGPGRLDVLRYAIGVLLGTHRAMRDVQYLRAEKLDIGPGAHVQADGDYLGETPVTITDSAATLRLVY